MGIFESGFERLDRKGPGGHCVPYAPLLSVTLWWKAPASHCLPKLPPNPYMATTTPTITTTIIPPPPQMLILPACQEVLDKFATADSDSVHQNRFVLTCVLFHSPLLQKYVIYAVLGSFPVGWVQSVKDKHVNNILGKNPEMH